MRIAMWACLLALGACSDQSRTFHLDTSAFDSELLVLAVFDAERQLSKSVVVEIDNPESEAIILAEPEGGSVLGLELGRVQLEAATPRVDWSRVGELAFVDRVHREIGCPEGVISSDGQRTVVGLPPDAPAFAVDPDALEPRRLGSDRGRLDEMELTVPVNSDRCAGQSPMSTRPFASQLKPIAYEAPVGPTPGPIGEKHRLMALHRFDDSRVLALFTRYLVVLERGQDFLNQPGQYLRATPGYQFRGFAVGPERPETGAARIVVLERATTSTTEGSRILELTFSDASLSEARPIWESVRKPDGLYVAAKDDRMVFFLAPTSIMAEVSRGGLIEEQALLPDRDVPGSYEARFFDSGLTSHPIAVVGSHRGAAFLGNVETKQWLVRADGLEAGFRVAAFTQSPGPTGAPRLWTGNDGGFLYQSDPSSSAWTRLRLRLDPRLIEAHCANAALDQCGFAEPGDAWTSISAITAPDGAAMLLGIPQHCSIGFVSRTDGCVGHVALSQGGPLLREVSDDIVGAHAIEGFVTVFTESGEIYEIEL